MPLKDFIPPVLLKLRKTAPSEKPQTFGSYQEALKACSSHAYMDSELCDVVAQKTVAYKEKLIQRPYDITPNQAYLLSVINQYIQYSNLKTISLLDFGGACGSHYFEIIRLLDKSIKIDWNVVETPSMRHAALTHELEDLNLTFRQSIEELHRKPDILHSSSAIQYVADPYRIVNSMIKRNPNWLFFNRMMFNAKDQDLITVQTSTLSGNGPGPLPKGFKDKKVMYPHTTMSFKKFKNKFLEAGYHLRWEFDEPSGHFQIPGENIIGKGILFTNNSN
jgi:putative methyltransferase (TIGR04325 family)